MLHRSQSTKCYWTVNTLVSERLGRAQTTWREVLQNNVVSAVLSVSEVELKRILSTEILLCVNEDQQHVPGKVCWLCGATADWNLYLCGAEMSSNEMRIIREHKWVRYWIHSSCLQATKPLFFSRRMKDDECIMLYVSRSAWLLTRTLNYGGILFRN